MSRRDDECLENAVKLSTMCIANVILVACKSANHAESYAVVTAYETHLDLSEPHIEQNVCKSRLSALMNVQT